MAQDTASIKKEKNRERQKKFWASKTPEEKRRLRLRYALNTILRKEEKLNARMD